MLVAPGAVNVTVCGEVKVPSSGLAVGVAARGANAHWKEETAELPFE